MAATAAHSTEQVLEDERPVSPDRGGREAGDKELARLHAAVGNGAVARLLEPIRSELNRPGEKLLPGVRLHRGPGAARAAEAANATAFTVGRDIVLGARVPPLTAREGRRVLAHELVHVLQQSGAGQPHSLGLVPPGSRAEQQAAAGVAVPGAETGLARIEEKDLTQLDAQQLEAERSLAQKWVADHPSGPEHEAGTRYVAKIEQAIVARHGAGASAGTSEGPRSLEQVLQDPGAAARVRAQALQGKSEVGEVKGALTEEVLNEQLRTSLQTPEGRAQLLPPWAKSMDVKFYEGYRITDADGVKLTDGMVLSGEGDVREVVAVAEAKSGQRRSSDLHLREERRPPRSAVEERQAELEKGGAGESALKEAESGGQIAADRERLLEFPKVRIYSEDLSRFEEVEVRLTPRTRWIAAAPKDVSLRATERFFSDPTRSGYRLDVKTLKLPVTQRELATTEAKVLAEVGKAPRAAAPSPAASQSPKPAPDPQLESANPAPPPQQTAPPDVAAPDVAAPDVAAPDVSAPDVAPPAVPAPDVAAPDVAAPDVAAPNPPQSTAPAPKTGPPPLFPGGGEGPKIEMDPKPGGAAIVVYLAIKAFEWGLSKLARDVGTEPPEGVPINLRRDAAQAARRGLSARRVGEQTHWTRPSAQEEKQDEARARLGAPSLAAARENEAKKHWARAYIDVVKSDPKLEDQYIDAVLYLRDLEARDQAPTERRPEPRPILRSRPQ